ncbi:hypothetical protein GCM10010123_13050 [Pilimelia anulata]|uniref:Adenosylcobinamide kinase n=1 Tax=Pilimelia anulata TaxID=53371 RepID=A0A8J3B3H3_9ACTN|nr:bifunctional adenosylcobinamide kinase/adenosylcobinamide-phosphate guanylyltransferase [Pilimelia anulata]GGJ84798.1 hypothetical protein GCM10010123_13050 [Pilimelia anulata]
MSTSTGRWRSLLVLGGIRSGKSAYAERLVAGAPRVRYVATAAAPADDDPQWRARIAAHRQRRPESWHTEEPGDPAALADLLTGAAADEVLLVDDLGNWVAALLADAGADPAAAGAALAKAVAACPARVVLVSPEVGLTLVADNPLGRAFTDALGALNQAVADACDSVALVVAGQATPLKSGGAAPIPPGAAGVREIDAPPGARLPTLLDPPLPDEVLAGQARAELAALLPGLGPLGHAVGAAAGARGALPPPAFRRPAVLALHADHPGAAAVGELPGGAGRAELLAGRGPLAALAARAGAPVWVWSGPDAAPIEDGPALTETAARAALAAGYHATRRVIEEGADTLILAATGAGTASAGAAVVGAIGRVEPAAILPRLVDSEGLIDDASWMQRCAAIRGAVYRVRREDDPVAVLAQVGGADVAAAAGAVLAAAGARVPVLLDGPVGTAGAVAAVELAADVRHWCLVPDEGEGPLVRAAARQLGTTAATRLGLELGEGCAALVALGVLNAGVDLAAALLGDG